jgi:hypothetical protein
MNYPRVYSREFNDLRALSTSGSPWFSQHGNRVRNPHRQRVAIKRHEFLEHLPAASAATSCVADRCTVPATVSLSLLAPTRGATARSAVAVAMREPRALGVSANTGTIGIQCHVRRIPLMRSRTSRPWFTPVTPVALSRRRAMRTSTCTTPLETV